MSRPRAIAVAIGALAAPARPRPVRPARAVTTTAALQPSGDRAGGKAARCARRHRRRRRRSPPPCRPRSTASSPGRTRPVGRTGTKAAPRPRRRPQLVRCADFEGQRYCLGVGWTDDTEAEVRARVCHGRPGLRPRHRRTNTGDLDAAAALARRARMSPAPAPRPRPRRARPSAARSVAKVWLLRHEIQGVALPAGFLDRHPEARRPRPPPAGPRSRRPARPPTPTANASATPTTRPQADSDRHVLADGRGAGQDPARLPAPGRDPQPAPGRRADPHLLVRPDLDADDRVGLGRQRPAARPTGPSKLGTTTSGTAITAMVRVVNHNTGWDRAKYAGTYITLDIGSWSYHQWMLLMMRHIVDYRAPVVLHPILLQAVLPLPRRRRLRALPGRPRLRQERQEARPARLLRAVEPAALRPLRALHRPASSGASAYKSYRANQDHFQHNVGV